MNLNCPWHRSRRRTRIRLVAGLSVMLASTASVALPLISELYYDAVGTDDGAVFVEISGTAGTSLDGFRLEGINGGDGKVTQTIALSGTLGSSGLFVVADRTSAGTTLVPGADLLANFDFQNGPDSVVLIDPTGGVVDALGYGTFGAGVIFAGEGTPAPDAPAGSSLARRSALQDTGDNAADFLVSATPTPGTAPGTVPEPGAPAFLAAAWVGLRLRARYQRVPRLRGRG